MSLYITTGIGGQPQDHKINRRRGGLLAAAAWSLAGAAFVVPVVCESLAQETNGTRRGAALLVITALLVALATFIILALLWRTIVRSLGNAGLATIAVLASLQFAVSYAARIVGYVVGVALGPLYIFIDGIGSKGLSCLFLGMLLALLPRTGALALALLTVFSLNVITTGQASLLAVVFIAVSVALHEGLAALLGLTTFSPPRAATPPGWSFAVRAGVAIGGANALALYAQYDLYELLLRLYFDEWYKLSVSIVTGLLFGGCGAALGALIGLRLRRASL